MGASRPVVFRQPEDRRRRDDDSSLVAAVQGGDVSAYAELFRRHHLAVKRVCARRLGEVEADEVAQATFVRAFERIDQCLGDRRFGAWVQVIAQRLCLDLVRARSRTVPDDDPLRDDRLALNVVIDLDAGTVTEEALVRRERTERVQEALALLPDRQREVVVARHFEGRRPPEIAASLGLSVGAVDSLLLRARRRLALNYEHVLADSSAATPSVTGAGAGMASTGISAHLPALPDAVASAGAQTHLPSLPDAVATVVHHAAAALPAIHGDTHAPLRRLAAVVAAAAAPILISAPSAPSAPPTTATGAGPTVVVTVTPNVHPPPAERPLPAGAVAAGATPGGHGGPSATSAAASGGGGRGEAPAGVAEAAAAVDGVVRAGIGPITKPPAPTGPPSVAGPAVPPGLAAVVPATASEPGSAGRDKPVSTPPRRPPGPAVTVPTPPSVPPAGVTTAIPAAAAEAAISKVRPVPQPPATPAAAAAADSRARS